MGRVRLCAGITQILTRFVSDRSVNNRVRANSIDAEAMDLEDRLENAMNNQDNTGA